MSSLGEAHSVQIRTFKIVFDMEDLFSPPLPFNEFVKLNGSEPKPPRYRVMSLEFVTCPLDNMPIMITECASCPLFIRRTKGSIVHHRKGF